MELALSLGVNVNQPMAVLDTAEDDRKPASLKDGLGFCMALGVGFPEVGSVERKSAGREDDESGYIRGAGNCHQMNYEEERFKVSSPEPPLQLQLLPLSAFPPTQQPDHQLRLPCLTVGNDQPGSIQVSSEEAETGSPNSGMISFFRMDFGFGTKANSGGERRRRNDALPVTDDEESGSTRKKLRLSKEQSAFLEESFKEHTTLNPKQKLALAEKLNLRPRQVEVWFQNRRARTKLKQTEVDCEYLKSSCERLREENKRLQKELQELRALKKTTYNSPSNPKFFKQLPATTLSICSSCERLAAAAAATASGHTQMTQAHKTN